MSARPSPPALGWTRRRWLQALGVVGGGLVVGVPLSACSSAPELPALAGEGAQLGAFVQIRPDNQVHFYQPRAEMGQGVYSGMTSLLAEELGVDPRVIEVHHAGVHPTYRAPGSPLQVTGGSTSMHEAYLHLRQAGANVREAIRQAAAAELKVDPVSLRLEGGQVHHGAQAWPYGRFAQAAAALPLPQGAALKSASEFVVIGQEAAPLDAMAKSTGTAQFGMDVEVANLHRAVLVRCPVAGGRLASVQTQRVEAMPGVVKVVRLPHGVAVVARSYWQAKQAAGALEPAWDLPEMVTLSSAKLRAQMAQAMDSEAGEKASGQGDVASVWSASAKTIAATYWAPYLAHATMEPMNCVVRIEGERCEVWTGTQVPDITRAVAAHHAGVDVAQVSVYNQFLGGGFGRRLFNDCVAETAAIAKASGVPVQLIFSREDDMRHDRYRPASLMTYRASLDAQGRVQAWTAKRVGPNVMAHFVDEVTEAAVSAYLPWSTGDWLSKRGYGVMAAWVVDPSSVEGLLGDYAVPNSEVHHVTLDPGLPLGFWRSVGHSFSAFGVESFVDELAHASGQDPLAFRLAHCGDDTRMKAVLQLAAEQAGWGQAPAGRFLGIAAHRSFETAVAEVVELSMEGATPVVHKVTVAVDCGLAVNPHIVRQQMEGSVVFGLTAALYGEITLANGAVEQSNFHDYPMLRMNQAPQVSVHIVPSTQVPTGVGEPAVPPIAPALANAIFAATGQRLRELPLRPHA
jgi:isoquinoline 1-oxidoreductase subunit beta